MSLQERIRRADNEQALRALGYVRCRNNDHRWYAGGPGILEPCYQFQSVIDGSMVTTRADTLVYADRIEITKSWRPTEIVGCFATIAEYLDYCRAHGQLSEPGLPAFSNSWD